jgi:hypothetical protein
VTLFVDRDRHRVLTEIQSFVESIHHMIDPDMFRIDEHELTWMKRLLRGGQIGTTIRVSYNEIFVMETIVMAASEYTLRKSTPIRLNVTDEELERLTEWFSQAKDQLRSVEPTVQ